MKKIFSIILFIISILISCVALVSCKMKYRVTFYESENSTYQDVEGGSKLKYYEPIKEGYKFLGWFTEDDIEFDFDTPINKNLNLYASYEMKEWTVTFVIDKNDESKNIIKKVNTNFLVERVEDPTLDDYIFVGWVCNDELFDFKTKINSDLIIYAKYILDSEYTPKLTVSFNTVNGGNIDSITVRRLDKIGSLPTPTKEGYEFVGWYYNDILVDSEYEVTQIEDFVLVAKYIDK